MFVLKSAFLANMSGKNNKFHDAGYGGEADENSKDNYSFVFQFIKRYFKKIMLDK